MKKSRLLGLVSACLVVFSMLSAAVVQAQDIFLSFPDSDIAGESTNGNHLDEVNVLTFSWDLTTEAGKKSTTNVAINGLKLTKFVDSSTPALLTKAVMGENLGRAVLAIEKPNGCGPSGHLDYLVLTLNDAIIASVSSNLEQGQDRVIEQYVLNFSSISGAYTACTPAGPSGPFRWNIAKNS